LIIFYKLIFLFMKVFFILVCVTFFILGILGFQQPRFEMDGFAKKTSRDLREFMASERGLWPEYYDVESVVVDSNLENLRVTYVNHATFLLQSSKYNILIDPIWSDRASPVSFAGPKRVHNPYVAFEDLPAIDYVLITHGHYDHLDVPTLRKLKKSFDPVFVVGLGIENVLFSNLGTDTHVESLGWGEALDLPGLDAFIFETAFHWSKRGLFDYNDTLWGSFVVRLDGKTLYHAGDTGYWTHFKEIGSRYEIDLAMLPVGDYEPRWFMGQSHMNPLEAFDAMRDLGAASAVGMHFGTFQLASNSYQQVLDDFSVAALQNNDLDFVLPLSRDTLEIDIY